MQATIQSLIDKLEPLFPEIAGMTVSSDGLREAIHGCELRLVHAYEAVLVRRNHTDIMCIDLLVAVPHCLVVAHSVCARSCSIPAYAMGTRCCTSVNSELTIKHKCKTVPVLLHLCWSLLHVVCVLYKAVLKLGSSIQAVWWCV